VVIGLALGMVSAAVGDSVIETMLGDSGLLTMLHFSRRQESAADAEALAALAGYYGHVGGADRLFELLEATHGAARPPAFFSTHPVSADRIRALQALAAARGWKPGKPRPLPAGFSEWLAATAAVGAACAPTGEAGADLPEPMPTRRCPN
jgi:predicted Zn-dependent protease